MNIVCCPDSSVFLSRNIELNSSDDEKMLLHRDFLYPEGRLRPFFSLISERHAFGVICISFAEKSDAFILRDKRGQSEKLKQPSRLTKAAAQSLSFSLCCCKAPTDTNK